ncbi:hypothetical protein BGW80DRAFT_1465448 [Lactifluus volemus]|nr:hypothetical protein BGW80DRAFT_1465448 [Lactifluus volemus]
MSAPTPPPSPPAPPAPAAPPAPPAAPLAPPAPVFVTPAPTGDRTLLHCLGVAGPRLKATIESKNNNSNFKDPNMKAFNLPYRNMLTARTRVDLAEPMARDGVEVPLIMVKFCEVIEKHGITTMGV